MHGSFLSFDQLYFIFSFSASASPLRLHTEPLVMAEGQNVSQIQSPEWYLTGHCPNFAPHQPACTCLTDHTAGAACPFSADSAGYRLLVVVNKGDG